MMFEHLHSKSWCCKRNSYSWVLFFNLKSFPFSCGLFICFSVINGTGRKVLLLVPWILQQTVCKHIHNTLVLNRQLSLDIFLSAWPTHWKLVVVWLCSFHCQCDCLAMWRGSWWAQVKIVKVQIHCWPVRCASCRRILPESKIIL